MRHHFHSQHARRRLQYRSLHRQCISPPSDRSLSPFTDGAGDSLGEAATAGDEEPLIEGAGDASGVFMTKGEAEPSKEEGAGDDDASDASMWIGDGESLMEEVMGDASRSRFLEEAGDGDVSDSSTGCC